MIKLSMLRQRVADSRTSLLAAPPSFSLLNDFPLTESIFVVARSSVLNSTMQEQTSQQVKQLIHSFSQKIISYFKTDELLLLMCLI